MSRLVNKQAELVKVDILLHGEPVDAFSAIVHKDKAYSYGVTMTAKLKELIPRQQFEVPIQAAIGTSGDRTRDRPGSPQGRTGQVLRRRHHAEAQAARTAEGGQEADEDGRPGRGSRPRRSWLRSPPRIPGRPRRSSCATISCEQTQQNREIGTDCLHFSSPSTAAPRSSAWVRRPSRMRDLGRFAFWYARRASMGLTGSSCRVGTRRASLSMAPVIRVTTPLELSTRSAKVSPASQPVMTCLVLAKTPKLNTPF